MARRERHRRKVTLYLPRDLVRYADARAAELATSRTQVIRDALGAWRAEEEEELAREGYAFFAGESAAFAAASIAAVSEAVGRAR